MTTQVAAAAMVIPVTWIVEPATPTVPHVDVVNPAAEPVGDGADHPAGTATLSCPLLRPPAPAVKVNESVFPVWDALTVAGETARVVDDAGAAGAW